jgi:adenylate cyclase
LKLDLIALTRIDRRLAAVLAADIVGYSRMMGADETGTLETLKQWHREVFEPLSAEHGGRIVKLMGDGALVEFASVVDAVNCAVAIQEMLPEFNAGRQEGRSVKLRIGVNLGDIIIEGGDIFGDGVNVAARLQESAEPGEVVLSATAFEHAGAKISASFSDGGERLLKNIAKPVRIFRWPPHDGQPAISGSPAITLPDKPSIVVLPFDNMSGDREQEFFADGMVESITAALSRIRSFFVIARNSAFTYKGKAKDVREIGRELGVAYLLEGSFQKSGERVRITVQLIEIASGLHLWAEKYDGVISDIFELQDRITEQVAGAMQPSIRLAEVERARRKPPQELGAYDYAMRAMRHVWMLERSEAAKGLELVEKALEIDPEYPLALALAAWCWAQRSVYNWTDDIGLAQAKALALAERAANLSHDDPLILTVLGAVHNFGRNYGTARVLLERAISLDPNSAWTLSRLGWLEVYADRPQSARPYFERAIRLSPMDPMNFNNYVGIASSYQVEGNDEAAAENFQRALGERPNAFWIHRNLAPSLLAVGREAEARRSLAALTAAYPDMSVEKFRRAMVFSPRVLDRICDLLRRLGIPEQ